MTEPRIQYAKTSDGVSIAYSTLGEGTPLVSLPAIFSHAQLNWQMPEFRRFSERLAEGRRVVSYDHRGAGLSDRDVSDFSPDALTLDLEAVVDHLELNSFALVGGGPVGMAAIAYAARHPERVTKLILAGAYARTLSDTPAVGALRQLLEMEDWELYTETLAHYFYGLAEGQATQRWAAYFRESMTLQAFQTMMSQWLDHDVIEFLPQVKSPTLVIHPRGSRYVPLDAARHLASGIPDARLIVVEGDSVLSSDVWEAVVAAINEFLDEGEEDVPSAKKPAGEDIHTILFTDVEGSTALTDRLGDAKARELLREHERMVREALKAHGGSEVKALGDGFMASFSSATRALECAIAIQSAFAERNQSAEEPILVRVGLNAGEPIAEDEDLFGASVNRAARIAAMAQGGEILAANVVRELAEGKGFLFGDRGETALRGFDDPVRLFEVKWQYD